MIRSAFLSLALVLPLGACGDAGPEADASRAAAVFYDIVLSERSGGVPGEEMRDRLRTVISPDLDSLIAQAAEAERRHTERTQNSEPPYLQGDIFSSLFEGPTAYEVGTCEQRDENGDALARCDVLLVHEADEPVQWTDRAILVANGGPEDRRWLVDDIQYGGDWDFAMKGSLKASLKAVIAEEE